MESVYNGQRKFTRSGSVGASELEGVGGALFLDGVLTEIAFEVSNEGDVALADFALQVKPHADGGWHTVISGQGWENGGIVLLPWVSDDDVNALPSGSARAAMVHVGPVHSVRFLAQAASATTDVQILASAWM
jgi:hypothetical protein